MTEYDTFFSTLLRPESLTIAAITGFFTGLVSYATFAYNFYIKKNELNRKDTDEFYKIVDEISGIMIKRENLAKELDIEVGSRAFQRNLAMLNDRADLLLSRANAIIGRGIDPTDVSLKLIGGMLLELGRADEAAEYHEKAVRCSSSPLKEAINRRSFGRSLILSNKFDLGRDEMKLAIQKFIDLGKESSYDQRTLFYRSIDARISLVDAQIRVERRRFISEDLKDLIEAISIVDERPRKQAYENSLTSLKFQLKVVYPDFAL
ncbi:hypothetical protein [Methylobacterium brachiatum]